jgi:hypothetical protein
MYSNQRNGGRPQEVIALVGPMSNPSRYGMSEQVFLAISLHWEFWVSYRPLPLYGVVARSELAGRTYHPWRTDWPCAQS